MFIGAPAPGWVPAAEKRELPAVLLKFEVLPPQMMRSHSKFLPTRTAAVAKESQSLISVFVRRTSRRSSGLFEQCTSEVV